MDPVKTGGAEHNQQSENQPSDSPGESGEAASSERDEPTGSQSDQPAAFSLLTDVRSGVAGAAPRIVLSLAAAIALAAAVLLVLGTFAAWTSPLGTFSSDGAISMGLAAAALGWVFALAWIWTPYDRRLRRPIGAGLTFVGVWLICLVVCVAVEAMVGPERAKWLLQIGCVLIAANLTLLGGLRLIYSPRAAGAVSRRAADVAVHCPRCGYSMKGLTECRCPECGTAYSIDTLIHLQQARPRREPAVAETRPADAPPSDRRAAPAPTQPQDARDIPPAGLAFES